MHSDKETMRRRKRNWLTHLLQYKERAVHIRRDFSNLDFSAVEESSVKRILRKLRYHSLKPKFKCIKLAVNFLSLHFVCNVSFISELLPNTYRYWLFHYLLHWLHFLFLYFVFEIQRFKFNTTQYTLRRKIVWHENRNFFDLTYL